jgi:hypothetical protein
MHDPMVVAFEIPRPWPSRNFHPASRRKADPRFKIRYRHHCDDPSTCNGCLGRPNSEMFPWYRLRSYTKFPVLFGHEFYVPSMITIWHVEPGGADSGEVCKHYRRWQDEDGKWQTKITSGWRWHVHHWKIQVRPFQQIRRRLLTKCTWCKGSHHKNDPVNCSNGSRSEKSRWWQGEKGLFHSGCTSVWEAHQTCLCEHPMLPHYGYGTCELCGKGRSWEKDGRLRGRDAIQALAALPEGARMTPEMKEFVEAVWKEERESSDSS